MKIALITDTHFLTKNDNLAFADYFSRFYKNVFIPYLKEHNIKYMLHLGDIFDKRKSVSFYAANRMKEDLVIPLHQLGVESHYIIGNHDVPYKNLNMYNSMESLFHNTNYNLKYYENATEIEIDGTPILLIPWINQENFEHTMELVKSTKAQIMFGHLELQGFQMYLGSVNTDGLEPGIFSKFDIVGTGHFHHKSTEGNIHYLGAPYEMTWSDFNDPRGFHVFDTATRELTYIQNPHRMFHKLYYNDETVEQSVTQDLSHIKDCVVKVIIINKTNPLMYDQFMDKIEKTGVSEIQVVDDHRNLNVVDDEDLISGVEDTITIMNNYVKKMEVVDKDKSALDLLFRQLHEEVMNLENE